MVPRNIFWFCQKGEVLSSFWTKTTWFTVQIRTNAATWLSVSPGKSARPARSSCEGKCCPLSKPCKTQLDLAAKFADISWSTGKVLSVSLETCLDSWHNVLTCCAENLLIFLTTICMSIWFCWFCLSNKVARWNAVQTSQQTRGCAVWDCWFWLSF